MSIFCAQNRIAHIEEFSAKYQGEQPQYEHAALLHRHESCEIIYIVKSSRTVFIDDRNGLLRENQFYFLDSNVEHSTEAYPGGSFCSLYLKFICRPAGEGIDFRPLERNCAEFRNFIKLGAKSFLLQDNAKLGFALKDLIDELATGAGDSYIVSLLFQRMLIELARCCAKGNQSAGIVHLNKAVQFIDENLCEPLDVSAVSAHVGINHSYLQTLFAKEYGCGILSFINRRRMEKAALLLANTNDSVTDIAFSAGCNSRQHFNYLFRKQFNLTPTQFRRLKGHADKISGIDPA